MHSFASVMGHPIHSMLVAFPIALLFSVLMGDGFFLVTRDEGWYRFSYLCLLTGFFWTVAAAIPGFIDFLAIPMANLVYWHMKVGIAVIVVTAVHLYVRRRAMRAEPLRVQPFFSVLTALLLLVQGYLGGELIYRYHVGVIPTPPASPSETAPGTISGRTLPTAAAPAMIRVSVPAAVKQGEEIFKAKCAGCHAVLGHGGDAGPDLSHTGSVRGAKWLELQIRNPSAHNAHAQMPSFALPRDQLRSLTAYLVTLK